jgi:hypothetical protein
MKRVYAAMETVRWLNYGTGGWMLDVGYQKPSRKSQLGLMAETADQTRSNGVADFAIVANGYDG